MTIGPARKGARIFAQLKLKSEARCIIMLRFLNGNKIEIPQLVNNHQI